jgi:RHS repeat-associated protein
VLIAKTFFQHSRGRIRQINEYYPYGLTWSRPEDTNMRAYQSKSYQQNEWTTSGMELYDFHARMYDPVIGRWHAPDPMNQFDSPYNAMADNPVVSIDPDGMRVPTGGILGAIGFMGRLTMVRKMIESTGRDMIFEEVLGFKDNGVSGALELVGAALAFNEGSQILSEGQHNLGSDAIKFDPTPNTVGAPVAYRANLIGYETEPLSPQTVINSARYQLVPGPNIYVKTEKYLEVFFEPVFSDGSTTTEGNYFGVKPISVPANRSPTSPLNVTLDSKGELDANSRTAIDNAINALITFANSFNDPIKDHHSPWNLVIVGGGAWSSNPVADQALMDKVNNYIKISYKNTFHLSLNYNSFYRSTAPGMASSVPVIDGQVAFEFSMKIHMYPW